MFRQDEFGTTTSGPTVTVSYTVNGEKHPSAQTYATPNQYDASGARISAAFRAFHKEHPEVYELLIHYAREAKTRGRRKMGIGMFWERLRWYVYMEYTGRPYKLNNNFRSRYARLIEETEPDLRGFFETRRLRSMA